MTTMADPTLCPQDLIESALAVSGGEPARGLAAVDDLLDDYPADPRLHFLRGSMLASLQSFEAARDAMGQAVSLDPRFHLARFQLGLLAFTSGDAAQALEVWGPLASLPADAPLRLFALGLQALARDQFDEAIAFLEEGRRQNHANLPLNNDMGLIVGAITAHLQGEGPQGEDGAVSASHLLLKQYGARGTLN